MGNEIQRSSSMSADGEGKMNRPPPPGENRPPPPENQNGIVASLAHEINNPLAALLNLLHLIESEVPLTNKGRQYLALSHEEVQRISNILHTAMEFRDAGDPEETNVPALLRSVLDFYRSRFASRGISLNTRYCPAVTVPAYPRQLRQMFSNLLLNASDAMPRGGKIYARISMTREWRGHERRGLRLTFADNGSGIPAEDFPRMLDPFFTTKGSAGNGLGLSLVKNSVQKHHGVLRVRSSTRAGHSGTVFTVFLPCALE
jgi:two-component system, chemotaxis family, CheB/CheR fusion protein